MDQEINPDAELDCVGFYCPMPISMTKEEIDKIEVGQILKIEADDPAAEEDIPLLAKRLGLVLLEMHKEKDQIHFVLKKIK